MKAPRSQQNELTEQEREAAIKAFEGLGLCTQLAEAAAGLGWKQPTVIQQQAVPPLIQGVRVWRVLLSCGRVSCTCASTARKKEVCGCIACDCVSGSSRH